MTLRLDDPLPSLLVPVRLDVFATREITRRGRTRTVSCAWQAWNTDPIMEGRMARLAGSGSFYWPNAIRAYIAARDIMTMDARVHQIKIETISGREIGRIYK